MGGMESKCRRCDGVGKVAPIVEIVQPIINLPPVEVVTLPHIVATTSNEPIPNNDMFDGKQDTCSLADIFPGIENVTPIESKSKPEKVMEMSPQLQAALDETKMTKAAWNTKYDKLMAGIDAKMRNEMRTEYAKSKKIAPRKVNQMAAQNGVSEVDDE